MQHVGCLTAQLCLSDDIAYMIHAMLCTLKGIKSKRNVYTHAATSPFRYSKVPPWMSLCKSSAIPAAVDRYLANRHDDIDIRGCSSSRAQARPDSFYLSCPRCDRCVNLASRNLFFRNKWVQIRCKSCRAVTASSKWRCSCGVRWHHCPAHRTDGFKCASNRRRKNPKNVRLNNRQLRTSQLISRIGALGASDAVLVKPRKISKLSGSCRSPAIATAVSAASFAAAPACNGMTNSSCTSNEDPPPFFQDDSNTSLPCVGTVAYTKGEVKTVLELLNTSKAKKPSEGNSKSVFLLQDVSFNDRLVRETSTVSSPVHDNYYW